MKSIGDHYIEAYAPIVTRRKTHPFGEREKRFKNIVAGAMSNLISSMTVAHYLACNQMAEQNLFSCHYLPK